MAGVVFLSACSKQRQLTKVREDATIKFQEGNLQDALVDWGEAVDRDPGDHRGRIGLGQTYMALGRPDEAREQFEVAHELRRDDHDILDLLCESMVAADQVGDMHNLLEDRAQTRQTAREWHFFGKWAANVGDIDTAERAFLTAAKADAGKNAVYQLSLANFYGGIGDNAEALRRLRMAMFLDPENFEIQDRIRAMGQVPGPSYALVPDELER
ncbi:MAG: tetratricopeptide repeat protein [Planctomycetota bacterium]|jgi:tetratricopeptide (TPR) repeat protein